MCYNREEISVNYFFNSKHCLYTFVIATGAAIEDLTQGFAHP